jgi:hypothetical protein
MWPALPASEYYDGSAPPGPFGRRRAYPERRAGYPPPGAVTRRFPCSPVDRFPEEAPDFAPAASPRLRRRLSPWPPGGREKVTAREFPTPAIEAGAHRDRPRSVRFEPVTTLRDVTRRFLAYTFPSRSPDPPHLTVLDTSRLCQGRLPPSPAPPGSGCPQLRQAAATTRRKRSFTPSRSTSASRRTLPVRQPLRGQGQHHFVDTGQPPLPLRDDLRSNVPEVCGTLTSTGPTSASTLSAGSRCGSCRAPADGIVLLIAEVTVISPSRADSKTRLVNRCSSPPCPVSCSSSGRARSTNIATSYSSNTGAGCPDSALSTGSTASNSTAVSDR